MAYAPKTWANGELITAEDLNRIEKGVGAPPAAHTHPVSDVTGLADRLAALEYNSGPRDITKYLYSSDWVADRATIIRTPGGNITLTFTGLRRVATAASAVVFTAPAGFRPPAMPGHARAVYGAVNYGTPVISARFDVETQGNVRTSLNVGDSAMTATLQWTTPDPIPTTLPGVPA